MTDGPSGDAEASDGEDRSANKPTGALQAIEHASLWLERPVRRVVGSNRLNPLPHAGTISVFLLAVVLVSGLYITLFYEFGFAASYDSVAGMEDHAIQRVARAVHRYSSAALVVTIVVHAWRIFAAGRYEGRARRWRWASGVSALGIVWLAGVSGYWMVWDRRAAAISEIVIEFAKSTGVGAQFAVRQLSGVSSDSGSTFMVLLWFVHLGLSAVIGYVTYRHLRRSKLAWFPPRHWMGLMGGALLAASLIFPLGMLGPARADQVVSDMPLDPFVLFLLPPLLSNMAWLATGVFAVAFAALLFLPRMLLRKDPSPVVIDEDACTGCELCVADCPYDALSMVDRSMVDGSAGPIAVVAPDACVACGICIGSCAFAAIDLPGWSSRSVDDVAGRDVVVACERHLEYADLTDTEDHVLIPVRCAGMMAPNAVRAYYDAGAEHVQLVGCAPSDCRYGVGNRVAAERLSGDRAPHAPRRYAELIDTDWISPSGFDDALAEPGKHTAADGTERPLGRNALVGAGAVVVLSIAGVAVATRAPFRTSSDAAEIRVVVDHDAGLQLDGYGAAPGAIDVVEVSVDGNVLDSASIPQRGSTSIGLGTWSVEPGESRVEVTAIGDEIRTVLFDDVAVIEPESRFVVAATDVPAPPGAREGQRVFESRAAGCTVCHSTSPGVEKVGPSLAGIGSAAGDRVDGLTAELYLRQSLLLPDQYVVEGKRAGQMPSFRDRLTEEEIDAVIFYLLTLKGDEG